MFSDIVAPKKNKNTLNQIKANPEQVKVLKEEPFFTEREIYHTVDGRDRGSKTPYVLMFLILLILAAVYYSVFNDKTFIYFESKSTIIEIKDRIQLTLSENNQSASTTLSYNLIYNNEVKDRNIFAPVSQDQQDQEIVSSGNFFNLNTSTTSPFTSKKVQLINESNNSIQIIKDTRFDVNGVTYYLDRPVNIPATKISTTTDAIKYKVIGFKNTSNYDKFYAVDFIDSNSAVVEDVKSEENLSSNSVPGEEILSLIPDNFIPLKKSYIYDKRINQSALVVIDKIDFENVLISNSNLMRDYTQTFASISDLIEFKININDYDVEIDNQTGLPLAFRNLNIEIIPMIKKDKVASAFQGFSKNTMKEIKNNISKNIKMDVKYSPFWVNNVSNEDNISVEVK